MSDNLTVDEQNNIISMYKNNLNVNQIALKTKIKIKIITKVIESNGLSVKKLTYKEKLELLDEHKQYILDSKKRGIKIRVLCGELGVEPNLINRYMHMIGEHKVLNGEYDEEVLRLKKEGYTNSDIENLLGIGRNDIILIVCKLIYEGKMTKKANRKNKLETKADINITDNMSEVELEKAILALRLNCTPISDIANKIKKDDLYVSGVINKLIKKEIDIDNKIAIITGNSKIGLRVVIDYYTLILKSKNNKNDTICNRKALYIINIVEKLRLRKKEEIKELKEWVSLKSKGDVINV